MNTPQKKTKTAGNFRELPVVVNNTQKLDDDFDMGKFLKIVEANRNRRG